MSDIVWCDIGGHPFSAADPGRQFWTVAGNEYGQDQSKARLDACAEHANFRAKMPDFTSGAQSRQAIDSNLQAHKAQEAKDKGYDPDYVKWLEAQASKPITEFEDESAP